MGVKNFVVLLSLLFIFINQSDGVPRFANYFQDHMVLQRAPQRAIVWGFGDTSQITTLQMGNNVYTTVSDTQSMNEFNESIWSVTLDPVTDEGPYDIHVSQPLANGTLITITIHDVLFGDVWVCSGQSNMQMTVSLIFNATEEIANAGNYPKIRVFTAAQEPSITPIEELIQILQNWSIASPQSIGGPQWVYFSAVCWLYGRMIHQALGGRPMGLVATSYGGTGIELWTPTAGIHECFNQTNETTVFKSHEYSLEVSGVDLNYSSLYNAMIYPFTRMVIYGVIWYQGESNSGRNTDKYVCTFSRLIHYWRQTWNQRTNGITDIQFPFGFVQLSTDTNTTTFFGVPWIRWHQTFDVGYAPNNVVPNVFMAVTLDLRDDNNTVHPRTKHDVGYRLSRAGLAVAYGQKVEFQGPIVSNVSYINGSNTVTFTYTGVTAIELRYNIGFEVCCQGHRCGNDNYWTPANITNKDTLSVTIAVPSFCTGLPLNGVRYLWKETPCPFKQAPIYSATDSNLPSPPYYKLF